jgi:hypothetical protein
VAEVFGDPEDGVLHFATRPSEEPQQDWPDDRKLISLGQVYRGVPWMDLERVLADVKSPERAIPWSEKKRFFFNWRVRGSAAEAWMPADLWDGAAGAVELAPKVPTFVVVRIAHDHRTAAIAAAQRHGDQVMVTSHVHQAEGNDYLSASALEGEVLALRRAHPAMVLAPKRFSPRGKEYLRPQPGPEVGYHSSFFESSAQRLAAMGVVMVDVPSSAERTTPAAETLMRLVTDGQLLHDGDPVTATHMGNVVAKQAPKGWAIGAADGATDGEHLPIVGAQAVMLAVHRAMTAPATPKYRTRLS